MRKNNIYVKLLNAVPRNAKFYLKEHKFVVRKSRIGLDEPFSIVYKNESEFTIKNRKKRKSRSFANTILLSTESEDGYAIKLDKNFTENDLKFG